MSLTYDLYQPGRSWLHRADPRIKLLGVLCASGGLLTTQNLWLMLVALVSVQGLLLSAGITRARLAWVWRATLPTMTLIVVLWVLLNPPQEGPVFAWWIVRLGPYSVAQGLAIALRIATLAFVAFTWLFTTDQSALILSLVALGLPYTWGLTAAMALRYLPTMAGIFRTISEAQQARALDLSQGGPIRKVKAYIPITIAMLITALRMAQNISFALESRALGAVPQRTYFHRLRFRKQDLFYGIIIAAGTGLFFWARFALGLGAHPLRLWH